MKALKVLALVLLNLLLVILLSVFGLAFTVNQTALNPHFVTGFINDTDFSQLLQETLKQQPSDGGGGTPPELNDAVIDTLTKAEPVIKEKLAIAIEDTYAYLKGKSAAPDLKKTLGDSFMNPDFVEKFLAQVDLTQIVNEMLKQQGAAGDATSDALMTSMLDTVRKLEPSIKQQIVAISGPVFKYVLSETNTIDLKTMLRATVFSRSFIMEMINALDIKTLAQDMLGDQLNVDLPSGISLSGTGVDQLAAALEPGLKQGLIASADPIADWLLGIKPSFKATISLEPALPTAKAIARQAFLRQLPPELSAATPAQIDQAFELFWTEARQALPASFTMDSSALGAGFSGQFTGMLDSFQSSLDDVRSQIDSAALDFEQQLTEVRPYVRMFQTWYTVLIIVILLLIAGIALIHWSVRGACLHLGIYFLAHGVVGLVGVVVLRGYLASPGFLQKQMQDAPQFVIDMTARAINAITQPMFMITLVVAILGIALLVVSFVYPKKGPTTAQAIPTTSTPVS